MRTWIQLFTLMRIRILLLFKAMWICDHAGLQTCTLYSPPFWASKSLTSIAPFWASKTHEFWLYCWLGSRSGSRFSLHCGSGCLKQCRSMRIRIRSPEYYCASAQYQQHILRIYVHFSYFSSGNRRLSTEGSAAGQRGPTECWNIAEMWGVPTRPGNKMYKWHARYDYNTTTIWPPQPNKLRFRFRFRFRFH